MGDRYLPAFPELLEGWSGPVQWTPDVGSGDTAGLAYVLDTHRPEVIAHLLRWLYSQGRGRSHHLRPAWLGGFLTDAEAGAALAWSVRSVRAGGAVLRGILSVWADATDRDDAYYEWGYRKWERGEIVGAPHLVCYLYEPRPDAVRVSRWSLRGWGLGWGANDRGPETGPDGMAAADRAALAAGYALRQPDGSITLPPC